MHDGAQAFADRLAGFPHGTPRFLKRPAHFIALHALGFAQGTLRFSASLPRSFSRLANRHLMVPCRALGVTACRFGGLMGFAERLLRLPVNVPHLAGDIAMHAHQLPRGFLHRLTRGLAGFPGGLAGFARRGFTLRVMLRGSQHKQGQVAGGVIAHGTHRTAAQRNHSRYRQNA
jgi:hypothetical protein